MKSISALENIHKQGLFGDYENKNEDNVAKNKDRKIFKKRKFRKKFYKKKTK